MILGFLFWHAELGLFINPDTIPNTDNNLKYHLYGCLLNRRWKAQHFVFIDQKAAHRSMQGAG